MSEKAVGSVRAQQLDEECRVTGEVRQVRARARRYDERQVRDGMAPTRRPQPRPKASAKRHQVQSVTSSGAIRAQKHLLDEGERNQSQSVAISRNQSQSVAISRNQSPSSGHQRTPRGMHRAVQLE